MIHCKLFHCYQDDNALLSLSNVITDFYKGHPNIGILNGFSLHDSQSLQINAYTELLETQSSRYRLVAISHEIFVRNHSNFETKCQMGSKRCLFSLFVKFLENKY